MRALLQQIVNIRLVELLDDLGIVLEQHGVGTLTEKLFHLLGVHLHILGIVFVHFSLRKVSGAEHSLLQTQFLTGPLEHLSLERATSNQTVDGDVFLLADAVAARHGLDVVLRVPITVEDDHRVRRSQVDTHTTRAGTEQKHKTVAVGVEAIDALLSLVATDPAVQALAIVLAELAVLINEINHLHHLTENQHFVAFLLQLGQ
mmetsp:Transcript_65506/g.115578  ORF Transcript_65506/g.115578 Transcript_65506/m.115578 type:complete len:203 (+) Transcript_65506:406-1014(+)